MLAKLLDHSLGLARPALNPNKTHRHLLPLVHRLAHGFQALKDGCKLAGGSGKRLSHLHLSSCSRGVQAMVGSSRYRMYECIEVSGVNTLPLLLETWLEVSAVNATCTQQSVMAHSRVLAFV